MGIPGNKREPSDNEQQKPRPATPAPENQDDGEDGDFATPKRDRSDDDDQPL
jgi:hypothetical protein